MLPELFEIPFIGLTIKSYGLMMVIGFLAAMAVIKRLSRDITPNSQMITNAALYSLIAGVIGSRIFYVVHYFDRFSDNLWSVFAIWEGGLELLGGVILAITVIVAYLRHHKLPVRRYLDILAIGLLLALGFGRIGCFLNGCCFGKPTSLPWGVRFPYGSFAYRSQVLPNLDRDRPLPQLELPAEFFDYYSDGEVLKLLKPREYLTEEQKLQVDTGPYRCLPVHPTQLYSSAAAFICCYLLYLFWRRERRAATQHRQKFLAKPGMVFCSMLVLYSVIRFFMEFVRDDNPFEFDGLTVSQNINLLTILFATGLMVVFAKMRSKGES